MQTDTYNSPFNARYASKEMQYIYSPDFKFKTWRKLWIALAEAEHELGLNVTQAQIDAGTTAVLTAIYKLAPYFDLFITALNGTCAATVGNQTGGCGGYKPLKGADVTLVALPYDGYTFVGWYDKINHRYMSRNTTYHFTATTNAQLQAVCVKTGSSTLTFATESGWISATVTRTTAEWAATDSLADLLPEVPYRYGYTATGWDCDERTVLEKLRSGQNVTLLPTYTADDTSLPTPSPAKDGVPVLDLYYKLDEKNNVGSFVMAAGWPDYLDIQSVGVAFYYKDAADFDPTDFTLLLNNKMLASNFNTDLCGEYKETLQPLQLGGQRVCKLLRPKRQAANRLLQPDQSDRPRAGIKTSEKAVAPVRRSGGLFLPKMRQHAPTPTRKMTKL